MSRNKVRNKSRNKFRSNRLRPLAGLLAAGLCLAGARRCSVQAYYPTYVAGPQENGSWVVSSGQVINPAGTQVNLGIRGAREGHRAEPQSQDSHRRRSHPGNVDVTATGPSRCSTPTPAMSCRTTSRSDAAIRAAAIAASPIRRTAQYLVFSQDSSNVTARQRHCTGLAGRRRPDQRAAEQFLHHLLSEQPSGAYAVPCGTFYTPSTSYPGGVAISQDGKSAYALLNQNDTLTQIDLVTKPAGYADPRRQRAAQHRDRQQRHDRLRQQ